MQRQTVDVGQAAAILGISRNQAYRMAKKGVLPVLRFGTRIVVPVAVLEKMLSGAIGGSGNAERPEVLVEKGLLVEDR